MKLGDACGAAAIARGTMPDGIGLGHAVIIAAVAKLAKGRHGEKDTAASVLGGAAIVGDTMQDGQTIVPPGQSLKDKVGRRSGLASVLGDAAVIGDLMQAGHKRVIAKSVKDLQKNEYAMRSFCAPDAKDVLLPLLQKKNKF